MSVETWSWQGLSRGLGSLPHSQTFRKSAGNAIYNVLDYFAQPFLMLVTAPFFVSRLGLEQYGIWMLASALAGALGIFGMGLSDATMKYVSAYRGREDPGGMRRIVSAGLTVNGLLSGVLAGTILLLAPVLVHQVFKIEPLYHGTAIRAIQLGGLLLLLRSIDLVFASALRACEQYAPSVKWSVLVKVATTGSAVLLVYMGYGVIAILLTTAGAMVVGLVLQANEARRVISGIWHWPALQGATWREIISFGSYSWLQCAAAVVFSYMDRLLIGAFLGTAAVAQYTVCMQLAQPVHGFPAAAFNFLFPHISARREAGDRQGTRSVFLLAVVANITLAVLVCLPLVIFGKGILSLWMGPSFAQQSHVLLSFLAISFGMLSINVVPHYTLLALGNARFVSIVNVAGGILSLTLAIVLMPRIGLLGAAVGRLFYGPVVSLNYVKVAKAL